MVLENVAIAVDGKTSVSGVWTIPDSAAGAFVLAHGAGAGMNHPFMSTFAVGLAEHHIAVLRFQFPYMERGSKRPDPPKLAHAAVRAAVAEAIGRFGHLPLFAGGKSFGGRMTSQAQAATPMPHVRGIAFLGFPLHPAGQPSVERADHLAHVRCPMLFLQGTRDELAELALVRGVVANLGERAKLLVFDDADHSFHVRAKSGSSDAAVREAMIDATVAWMRGIALQETD